MKFAVLGAGGVGGIVGAYLALAGNEVTFIARGAHLEALKKNGLVLRTAHRGDLIAIRSSGAYGEIMASCYNCRPLPQGFTSDEL